MDHEDPHEARTGTQPSAKGDSRANGSGGNGLIPHVVSPLLVPGATPAAPETESASAFPFKRLLGALRRCWFVAIGLGLVCGLTGAAAAYFLVPAPYTAFSELKISSVREKILFKTAEEQAQFQTYKQTQMRYVTSPFVLNAALRNPEVANLPTLQPLERPLEWLEKNVSIGSPGQEFVKISLSGERPKDLAAIVNEITTAYLNEVVNVDTLKRQKRHESLQKLRRDREERLLTKRNRLRSLSENIEAGNTTQSNAKQQYLYELHIQMRKEASKIHFELIQARLQFAAMTTSVQNVDETTDDGKQVQITSKLGKDIVVKVTETIEGEAKTSEFKAADFDELQKNSPLAAGYYEQFVTNRQTDIPESYVESKLSQDPEIAELEHKIRQKEKVIRDYESVAATNSGKLKKQEDLESMKEQLEKLKKQIRPRVIQQITIQLSAGADFSKADLRQQIAMLESEKGMLERQLDEVKRNEKKTGTLSFDLELLDKDIRQGEAILNTIVTEIQKLTIELDSPDRVRLHRQAEVPHTRELKKKVTGTVFAGFGMLALVAGAIVFFEFQARKISSADDVVEGLHLRIVGALPNMPRWVTNGHKRNNEARGIFWKSVLTESIDCARTMLLREANLEDIRVVMVASAMGGEGKTTLSCHLATSLARAGRKTLLVDCDIRRPSIHKVFDVPLTPGLCQLMKGDVEPKDAIQTVTQQNLEILPAGKVSQDVLQILAKDGLDALFEQFKQQYEFVVVDSAPVLPVTDSLLIAQSVDAVLFSIRRDVSRAAKVAAATQRLAMLGIPILGAVVIGLDDGSYAFRYPYRFGYGYGARYGYSYPTHPKA